MEYQNNKLRHELKYFISEAAYYDLRVQMRNFLKPDENMTDENGYTIRSMYFDDYRNTCASDKEDGVRIRSKYRVRIYNGSDTKISLEKKSKFDNYTSKSSAPLSREEYERILKGEYGFLSFKQNQTCMDLFCAHNTRLMRPKLIVDYLREAYYLREGNVRITFDKHLHAGVHSVNMFDPNLILSSVLPRNILILELKYDEFLPEFVKRILKGQPKDHCAISKYLLCVKELRKVKLYV
jgi:hypothetical protein